MTTDIFNRLATNCYYRTILDTFRVVKYFRYDINYTILYYIYDRL